jgi:hypothetical protein
MAFTSISPLSLNEWQAPLAEQPSQEPDLTVFTHASLESIRVTMPCSVAMMSTLGNEY